MLGFLKKKRKVKTNLAQLLGDNIEIKASSLCKVEGSPCIPVENLFRETIEILLNKGLVTQSYLQAVIHSYREYGDYMIYPKACTAIPHARPEDGVVKTSLSLVILQNALVHNNQPIQYVFGVAAKDSITHGHLIAAISRFMRNASLVESLKRATTPALIKKLLQTIEVEVEENPSVS